MQTVIKVEQLSKAYDNLLAVDKINLSVECGTVYGLLGANGVGRNATIECVLGTRNVDSEAVSVLSYNPRKDRCRLLQKVSTQFQERDCRPGIKVSELCGETACLYEAPTDQRSLCEQFDVGSKVGNAVKSLSGGECQRLSIVLALIPNPDLVFLDELTVGLNAKARRDVWKTLQELKRGRLTIFLTSHFVGGVEISYDEICILKQGKVVFYGTAEQTKAVSGCEELEGAYLTFSGKGAGE